ncbi:MAG: radical SAM protein [Steroidobacteraceae bacterium]
MSAIPLTALRELWVHTGTACNLSCPFCHEGSQPADTRLQALTLAEIKPVLDQAMAAGAQRFIFTGGEPLTAREIVPMLTFALTLLPTLVLTNATAPLIRRSQQLAVLAAQPQPLSFRVSIDFADEARHDAARGPKNFRKALQGLKLLREAGFAVSVACQQDPGSAARFAKLFERNGLPAALQLIELPELGRPGSQPVPVADLPIFAPRSDACCSTGRMLLRRDGELRFQACPLTDDDSRFDLGRELAVAMQASVRPQHHRCALCMRQGVNYSGFREMP